MNAGQENRWWRRRIPGKPLLFTAVFLVAATYWWIYWGDSTSALAWDVMHGRTATFRGQSLKVPWLWKKEPWTNYNEFRLTRYGSGPLSPSVTLEFGRFDPSVMHDRLKQMRARPSLANWTSEDYEGDDFTLTHYRCVRNGFCHSGLAIVDCFSLDGRWAVHLIGQADTYPDYNQILRGVAAMGDPSH